MNFSAFLSIVTKSTAERKLKVHIATENAKGTVKL